MALAFVYSRQAAEIALPRNADDEKAESLGESTTTSGTFQDKVTLTFTPASSGDYLIIAFAQLSQGTTLRNTLVKLLDNGTSTTYAQTSKRVGIAGNGEYYPWITMVKLTSLSGSQTFKIQYRRLVPGTTAKIQYACIIALRLDNFNENFYGSASGGATTTSTTFQDRLTVTDTPAVACNYIILASCTQSNQSTSDSTEIRLIQDSEELIRSRLEPYGLLTQDQASFFGCFQRGLAKVSTTWKLQHRSVGGNNAAIYDAIIAVIQVGSVPTVNVLGKTSILGKVVVQ